MSGPSPATSAGSWQPRPSPEPGLGRWLQRLSRHSPRSPPRAWRELRVQSPSLAHLLVWVPHQGVTSRAGTVSGLLLGAPVSGTR